MNSEIFDWKMGALLSSAEGDFKKLMRARQILWDSPKRTDPKVEADYKDAQEKYADLKALKEAGKEALTPEIVSAWVAEWSAKKAGEEAKKSEAEKSKKASIDRALARLAK